MQMLSADLAKLEAKYETSQERKNRARPIEDFGRLD
jgi:hypothetical protein